MYTININASVPYCVKITRGGLKDFGNELRGVKKPCRAAVIADSNVYPLYADKVIESLQSAGYGTESYIIPAGEENKRISALEGILEFLASKKFSRSDILCAVGGGVTSDMAGFAAAVYLRGIDFAVCPTTVLAAIDASVGGKTAVDLSCGKNLVGAFHQPRLVLCDTDTFSTLPEQVYRDGISEAIKCGMISDPELFSLLESRDIRDCIDEVVLRAINVKKALVEQDEFDQGDRQLLNLGHTIGHAVEACSGYTLSHGSCVAIGLAYITRASYKNGWLKEDIRQRVYSLLEKFGLPVSCVYSSSQLASHALNDKKIAGDIISLVIPEKIGGSVLRRIKTSELENIISQGCPEDII